MDLIEMVCTKCKDNINFVTRRKCTTCLRYFCSKCLQRPFLTKGICPKCSLLKSGRFTHQQLKEYSVKELKYFLKTQNMSVGNCVEKEDLANLVFRSASMFTSSQDVEQTEHQRRVEHMKAGLGQKLEQSVRQNTSSTIEIDAESEAGMEDVVEGGDVLGDEEADSSSQDAEPQVSPSHQPHEPSDHPSITTSLPSSTSSSSDATATLFPSHSSTPSEPPWLPPPPSYEELFQNNGNLPQQNILHQQQPTPSQQMPQQPTQPQQQPQQPHISNTGFSTKHPKKNFDYVIRLEQIEKEDDIDELSIKQLKTILANNFVTCKGCCEKNELSSLVLKLFRERCKNLLSESNPPSSPSSQHSDLCKICMEHVIDCVLLECGHMVSCTQCSKRLHQCPVCRCLVSRVVHIFKA